MDKPGLSKTGRLGYYYTKRRSDNMISLQAVKDDMTELESKQAERLSERVNTCLFMMEDREEVRRQEQSQYKLFGIIEALVTSHNRPVQADDGTYYCINVSMSAETASAFCDTSQERETVAETVVYPLVYGVHPDTVVKMLQELW